MPDGSFYSLVGSGVFVLPPAVEEPPPPEPGDLVLYIAGNSNNIYKYDGLTEVWSTITVPTSETGGLSVSWAAIATASNNTQRILAYSLGGPGTLVFSDDGGGSWNGLSGPSFASGSSLDLITGCYVHTNGDLFISVIGTASAADGGLWRSTDDGVTWEHVMLANNNGGFSAQGIGKIAVTGTRFWMWSEHREAGSVSHVVESAILNISSPWTIDHPTVHAFTTFENIAGSSRQLLFLGAGSSIWTGLYYDTDNELTENYDLLKLDEEGNPTFYQFTNSGAAPWLRDEIISIIDYEDGTIVVIGRSQTGTLGHVFKSTDDGASWSHVVNNSADHRSGFTGAYGPSAMKDPNSDDIYRVTTTDNGAGGISVLKSSDRGNTWSPITSGADVPTANLAITVGRTS